MRRDDRELPDWEHMDYYERKLAKGSILAAFGFVMLIGAIIMGLLALTYSCAGPSKIQTVQQQEMRQEQRRAQRLRPQDLTVCFQLE